MSKNALATLSLTEIAQRISRHLKRLENTERVEIGDRRRFFMPSAQRRGSHVSVTYISYQGSVKLTREEALHYLAALDRGYAGWHVEYFRTHPLEKTEEPTVLFNALVRGSFGFALYAVTKRTASRLYGQKIAGDGYVGSYVEKDAAIKLQATEADLEKEREARKIREAEIKAAHERYEAALREIAGSKEDGDG